MSADIKNVFCFGDEHASSVYAGPQSWPQQLERTYYQTCQPALGEAGPHAVFYQLAIPGETAQQLSVNLDTDLLPRLYGRYRWRLPTMSVLSLGYADVYEASGRQDEALARYAENLGRVATTLLRSEEALAGERQLLYVGLPAIDEEKMCRSGVFMPNDAIRAFETVACEIVEAKGGQAVPLFDASAAHGFNEKYGLEPPYYTALGHDWVRQQVEPRFLDLILTPDSSN